MTSGWSNPTRYAHGLTTKRGSAKGCSSVQAPPSCSRRSSTSTDRPARRGTRQPRARCGHRRRRPRPTTSPPAPRRSGPPSRHHAGVPALTPEQAHRVYDRIARAQDWQRFYEDAATVDLVAHAGFGAAHAVVELGCGTGRFAASLLARHLPAGATYLGVDVSPRMVALTTDRLRPWSDRATAALVAGDGRMPAADGAADRYVANYVFDLLSAEAAGAALADARRVLAPGGLLCATGLTPGDQGLAGVVSRAWAGRVGALARARRRLPPDQARRRAGAGRVGDPPPPGGGGVGHRIRGGGRGAEVIRRSTARGCARAGRAPGRGGSGRA